MRCIIAVCAVAGALAVLPAGAAAQGFEGTVASRMTMKDHTANVLYSIKGDKSRVETSLEGASPEMQQMGSSVMIMDAGTGEVIHLMPGQKMYMRMNYREMAKGMESEDGETRDLKLKKTGRRETVAGYPCEHWLMGDEQTDVCLAKGLGFWGTTGEAGRGALSKLPGFRRQQIEAQLARHPELKELVDAGAFPLKVESADHKFTMVVTKIEKKRLGDDLFRPPPGYQEMNMGKMMEQMKQKHNQP